MVCHQEGKIRGRDEKTQIFVICEAKEKEPVCRCMDIIKTDSEEAGSRDMSCICLYRKRDQWHAGLNFRFP